MSIQGTSGLLRLVVRLRDSEAQSLVVGPNGTISVRVDCRGYCYHVAAVADVSRFSVVC